MGSEVQRYAGSAGYLLTHAPRAAVGPYPHLADPPLQGSAHHAARPALPPLQGSAHHAARAAGPPQHLVQDAQGSRPAASGYRQSLVTH